MQPLLDNPDPVHTYAPDSWGPTEGEDLVAAHGRWHGPWIVYNVMRTEDAVTNADGVEITFAGVILLYAALGAALIVTLRAMSRRWRDGDEDAVEVPYGPDARPPEESREGAPA